jgi:CubicO group peptidase (beta-lactamase class C family)
LRRDEVTGVTARAPAASVRDTPMSLNSYLARYLLWLQPTNRDFTRMPQRALQASPAPRPLAADPRACDLAPLAVTVRLGEPALALPRLLADTGTTALLVLRGGRICWEHHPRARSGIDSDGTRDANAAERERLNRCFSVTKSVASALVGIALGDGAIESLEQPIGHWLCELRDPRVRALSIAHLLEMRSGIRFSEGLLPWNDAPRTYYAVDLRRRLAGCKITDPVGAFFHYNDWHPQLLALLVERATGLRVTELIQRRLWDPLGCEYAGSVMVDRDDAAALEHLESGLSARARDLARFGQLYLQDGVWEGQRLLPEGWVEATTSPDGARTDAEWFAHYRGKPWGRFLARGDVYYRRMWWGVRLDADRHDYFAMGVLGQHVYVAPAQQVVVVRLSDRFPPGMWWPPVFGQIARAVAS